jgi:5-formyltetrahydrofolate cyclo-ligase
MTGSQPSVAAKGALRTVLKAVRSAFVDGLAPAARVALERNLAGQLETHLEIDRQFAVYVAFGSEISPASLGLACPPLLPRVGEAAAPLTFHCASADALVVSRFGVAEPPAGLPGIDPDIVLVPLLGVDRRGHRIGYGAGFYDRTLASLRRRGPVFAIGCAWDCQIIDDVPADEWDEPLDAVATPTRFLRIVPR